MKSKHAIAFAFMLLAVLLVAWLWPHTGNIQPTAGKPGASILSGNITSTIDSSAFTNLLAPSKSNLNGLEGNDPAGENEKRRQEFIERSLDEWRTPIEFYGKVVDEDNQPVQGVSVSFGVTDLSSNGHSTFQTGSDDNGVFSLRGVAGKHLSVNLEKRGYYVSNKNQRSFFYAGQNMNFVPNAKQPIVFYLRKHGRVDRLLTMDFPGFARIAQLPRNGAPVIFDLINGTTNIAKGGHIKFEFKGDPVSRETKRFNWQLRITAPGGLQETQVEFPFVAPKDGYVPEIEIHYPENLEDAWQTTIERKYFVRLSDGRYGRIAIRLLARNGVFTMQSYLNPSGSSNLEYSDAAQSQTETR